MQNEPVETPYATAFDKAFSHCFGIEVNGVMQMWETSLCGLSNTDRPKQRGIPSNACPICVALLWDRFGIR